MDILEKNKKDKIIFNHDKFSISKKKVLRGLHYDNKHGTLAVFMERYFL